MSIELEQNNPLKNIQKEIVRLRIERGKSNP